MIGARHVYLNVSQEGLDDVDDLREGGLIRGLKVRLAKVMHQSSDVLVLNRICACRRVFHAIS